ncbi:MAG: phage capsid protein [Pseudohongiellaceae bacterium]
MSQNSTAFYSQQYQTNVELLLQQMGPKVMPTFSMMTATGKAAVAADQIGAIEADERTTRYDDIVPKDPVHTRPWVYPRTFDASMFLDSFDQMRMLSDPKSKYVVNVVAAMGRKQDDEAIRAFFDARNIGETGSTSSNFPSAQQVGVNTGGTGSGLNVEKLQEAIQKLEEAEVDLDREQLYCVITPKQKRNLMNEIEVTSGDFFKGQVMSTRSVSGFLSINFIVSNRLLLDGSGYSRIPLYVPSGMMFCQWDGVKTDVSQRKDKRGLPWQCYGEVTSGAVRVEDGRVVEIKCAV